MSGSRLIVSLIGAVLALWGLVIHGQHPSAAGPAAQPATSAGADRYGIFAAVGTDAGDPAAADADAELVQQGRTLGIGMAGGGVLIAAVPWLTRRRAG
ncbi:hypothetical protein [Streptomyces niger]|uniref:hypothetical protein n=1 Tax=Streptomyces niger TaxID=66373 RepID=UPI0018FE8D44|nr:hypothetical protein [Streptomyces niger]